MTDHLQAATPSRRDFLKTCAAGVSASAITTLIPAGVKSAAYAGGSDAPEKAAAGSTGGARDEE